MLQTRPLNALAQQPSAEGMLPPYDRDAERAILGGILSEHEAGEGFARIARLGLTAADFLNATCGAAFTAAAAVSRRGSRCDPITVAEEMRRTGTGGLDNTLGDLMQLAGEYATVVGIDHYAAIVVRLAAYRRVLSVNQQIAQAAWRGGDDPVADINRWTELLQGAAPAQRQPPRTMADLTAQLLNPWLDEVEGTRPFRTVPSGLRGLDTILTGGGWPTARLSLVTAGTSMGKSTFARTVGRNASFLPHPEREGDTFHVLHISCEQPLEEVWEEHMAALSGYDRFVRQQQIKRGEETPADLSDRIVAAYNRAQSWESLKIVAQPGMTASEIGFEVEKHRGWGVDLVIMDYLQRVNGEPGRNDERERIATAARVFADVALQTGCAFLAIAQDRRPDDYKKDEHEYRPQLGSVYGSSEAEKVASVQATLYRRGFYVERGMLEPTNDYDDSVTEVIVLKQTRGRPGTARVMAYFNVSTMEDA